MFVKLFFLSLSFAGGRWCPEIDGSSPGSTDGLIAAAKRYLSKVTDCDVGKITDWFRLLDIHYKRESGLNEVTVVLIASTVEAVPEEEVCVCFKKMK